VGTRYSRQAPQGLMLVYHPETGELLGEHALPSPWQDISADEPVPPVFTPPVVGDPLGDGGDRWEVILAAGESVTLTTATPFDR
ncbi:hypothetical protein R0K19_26030, partial [Bacillus sp. SIMBA_161]